MESKKRGGKPNNRKDQSHSGDKKSSSFKKFDKSGSGSFKKSDKPFNDRRSDNAGEKRSYGSSTGFNSSSRGTTAPKTTFRKFDNDKKDRFPGKPEKPNRERKEDRPYNSDFSRPRSGDMPSRPPFKKFDKPRFEGNSDRPRRDEGDRRPFGRDSNRPADRADSRPPFKKFGDKKSPDSRDRQVGMKRAPRYDEESLKRKAPFKVREKFDEKREDEEVRLNRYISNSGLCSRREADELIASGMIKVNGKVMTEMGYKVQEGDTIKYGKNVLSRERMMYVLLNKPKDYITTMDDPNDRKTVMDLVGDACRERIYPVGRLDRNTTGLLLLTNDGELTEKLTHPSSNIKKVYQAELDKPFAEEHFEALRNGIELEDGFIKPDQVAFVTPDAEVIGLEIHSGKNRVVRRIFEHLGYEVTKLDRTTFAGLNKKELPRGKWRFLSEKEVIMLKYLV